MWKVRFREPKMIDYLIKNKSSSNSESEKTAIQDKINELTKNVDKLKLTLIDLENGLKTDFNDIETRLNKGTACALARWEVQKIFRTAITYAERETDPAIQAVRQKLIESWKSSSAEHEKIINDWDKAVEICKKCKNGEL